MKKLKKGFTLIELLAVIVILAIIALIATPILLNLIDESRNKANIKSAYGLIDAANLYYANNAAKDEFELDSNGEKDLLSVISYSGTGPDSGTVKVNEDGDISLSVQYGDKCYVKGYAESKVKEIACPGSESGTDENQGVLVDDNSNANEPQFNQFLVAVELGDDGTITVADTSNNNWYNYDESKWANAVVTESSFYGGSYSPGDIIDMDEVLTMYVWVPRFKVESVNGVNDAIDLEFVSTSETQDVHPAFSVAGLGYGKSELPGIWIGKFELDANNQTIPNSNINHRKSIEEYRQKIMENYRGPDYDVHMIKNTEWGAAAYLSQSKYGICPDGYCDGKVANNSYRDYWEKFTTTGCGGDDRDNIFSNGTADYSGSVCPDGHTWETSNGMKASTTHNITGIYDMAGGSNEYVMAVLRDEYDSNLINSADSEVSPNYVSQFGTRYIDVYDVENGNFVPIDGDATVETENWNQDFYFDLDQWNPWFARGGHAKGHVTSGIWAYSPQSGPEELQSMTTRVALFVE